MERALTGAGIQFLNGGSPGVRLIPATAGRKPKRPVAKTR
jgi:hypothetical protein